MLPAGTVAGRGGGVHRHAVRHRPAPRLPRPHQHHQLQAAGGLEAAPPRGPPSLPRPSGNRDNNIAYKRQTFGNLRVPAGGRADHRRPVLRGRRAAAVRPLLPPPRLLRGRGAAAHPGRPAILNQGGTNTTRQHWGENFITTWTRK